MEEVVEVTPEVIQDGSLSVCGDLGVSPEAIVRGIAEVDAAIAKAKKSAEDCRADAETLKGMDGKEITAIRKALSNDLKDAKNIKASFGKIFTEPKKAIDDAFKAAIADVQSLYDLYRGEEKRRGEECKQERYLELAQVFADFVPEGIAESIGFDRILEQQWLNPSLNAKKAENALTDKVASILSEWESFKRIKGKLVYPDECEREFWRTLSFSTASDKDEQLVQEQARIDAMNAEIAEVQAYQRQEVPQIVQETEQQVANVPAPEFEQVEVYLFALELTPRQRHELIGYLKAQGVHGKPIRTPFGRYEDAVRDYMEGRKDA